MGRLPIKAWAKVAILTTALASTPAYAADGVGFCGTIRLAETAVAMLDNQPIVKVFANSANGPSSPRYRRRGNRIDAGRRAADRRAASPSHGETDAWDHRRHSGRRIGAAQLHDRRRRSAAQESSGSADRDRERLVRAAGWSAWSRHPEQLRYRSRPAGAPYDPLSRAKLRDCLAGLGPTICSDRGGSISEQPLVFSGAARWPQDQCPVRYRRPILRALDANCAGAGCERRGIGARPCSDGARCRRRAIERARSSLFPTGGRRRGYPQCGNRRDRNQPERCRFRAGDRFSRFAAGLDFVWITAALPDASHLKVLLHDPPSHRTDRSPNVLLDLILCPRARGPTKRMPIRNAGEFVAAVKVVVGARSGSRSIPLGGWRAWSRRALPAAQGRQGWR